MKKREHVAIALLLCAGAGCDRSETSEPPTQGGGYAVVAPATSRSVADLITEAHCDREQRCVKVGWPTRHASREECEAEIGLDWRDELDVFDCPGGIDRDALDDCLTEIRNDDCDNPFDALERIVVCRPGKICRDRVL
jgi:hypothetical protein